MSDTTAAVNAAFDTIVEGITTEEPTLSTITVEPVSQSKSDTLTALIEVSGVAAETASAITGQIAGYESQFAASVVAFAAARDAGNTEDSCRKALQADSKQSGTKHFGATPAGGSAMDLLASLSRVEGDLPEGWVFRPDTNSGAAGIPLAEGEASLVALIRKVQAPADAAAIKAAGHGKAYGKAVVAGLIAAAESKVDAISALQAQERLLKKIVTEAKAAEKEPKTAQTFLKAASGPIGKVVDALDAGEVGDVDAVKALIASLKTSLAAIEAHAALAV